MARLRFRRSVVLSGDVAFVRLKISSRDFPLDFEEVIHGGPGRNGILQGEHEFESEVESAIKRQLGQEFQFRGIAFSEGSILALVVVGTIYEVVSKYKDFVESMQRLLSDLKTIFRRVFRGWATDVTVEASWSPALRANMDETTPPVVITEQGENRNPCEEQRNLFGFPHGFARRGT